MPPNLPPLNGGPDWTLLDALERCRRAEQLQRAWWEQRDVLIAQAHREGHSLQEIAAATELHVNTVARVCRFDSGAPDWKRSPWPKRGPTAGENVPQQVLADPQQVSADDEAREESTSVAAQPAAGLVAAVPDDPAKRARAFAQMVRGR